MQAEQPTLPGMTPRGRPRCGVSRVERVRCSQAARRATSDRKPLSAEVGKGLLAQFKSAASDRSLTLREAVETAINHWIMAGSPVPK